MKLWLIRHGLTRLGEEKRYQGALDEPLSERGRAELRRAEFNPPRVYVSPMCRARETAAILFPEVEQIVIPDLREMDFGDFEGRGWWEMENDPAYRAWVDGGCTGRCPNGESRAEFCARTCRAFAALVDLAAAEGREELVVVAHGGTQRAVMERFCEPAFGYFDLQPPFGGGYVLEYEAARWRRTQKLRLLREVRFTKEAEEC